MPSVLALIARGIMKPWLCYMPWLKGFGIPELLLRNHLHFG